MYRVLINNKSFPFDLFSDALEFSKESGGKLYIKECSCIYEN